jgi:hypothetical protein
MICRRTFVSGPIAPPTNFKSVIALIAKLSEDNP